MAPPSAASVPVRAKTLGAWAPKAGHQEKTCPGA
jgi:hypothetical protein